MALLTLAQAEYDPIKTKYDEYYKLANDEEANYEDKTKAEAKLLPVSKALERQRFLKMQINEKRLNRC